MVENIWHVTNISIRFDRVSMLWVLSTRVAQLINRVITYSMYTGFMLRVRVWISDFLSVCCVDWRGVGLEWRSAAYYF